jgi:hypothetical protein
MAYRAIGVSSRLRSAKIFTATGKAVMAMHRPRKIIRMASSPKTCAITRPDPKGNTKPSAAITRPGPFMARTTLVRSISRPAATTIRKTANSDMPDSAALGWIKPNTAGPSKTPASISPTTAGWL